MTDRINYLTVALERDIRVDDVEPLIAAIRMLRGVLKVEANVAHPMDWMSEERARNNLASKIYDVIQGKS